eukprot:TRINITY_DN9056_c0_g1_i1.p1 TRINITY_DN9056_c0_g1~~TRINITY_DN9056_c0_g1_i1.p1  ORF type:complete len:153 (+),score=9.54 TRINITY_DN9056_c0_g1_i1:47-505(+)
MLIEFGPTQLPVELINAILSFLPPWDLCSVSQVNTALHRLADADKMWKPILPILPTRVGLKKGARRQQKNRLKLPYKKQFEKEYLAARLRWARAKLPGAMCIHPPNIIVVQVTPAGGCTVRCTECRHGAKSSTMFSAEIDLKFEEMIRGRGG